VRLDRDAIRPNAAKRGLTKQCLNSLWGKLTERGKQTQTKLISDPNELYRFLATPGVEVETCCFLASVVWASWSYRPRNRFRAYVIPTRLSEHT
jgi:Mn-dependent DtxR family transcriptional regulator